MEPQHNVLGWFEVPVNDMERAIKFYEAVFQFKLSRNQMGPLDMAWFPWVDGGIGSPGSLVFLPEHYKPSSELLCIRGSKRFFTTTSINL
jgi:predicted enzyme related to lactoylglutathione lyase